MVGRYISWLGLLTMALGMYVTRSDDDTDYWTLRGEILTEENNRSFGGKLTFGYGERAANDILMVAKEEEIDRGFLDPAGFLPSLNFMTVTEDIRSSPTFQIIKSMPKGAMLHAHDTAFVSAEYVYENITFRDNLYVCRLDEDSLDFRFLYSAENDTSCSSTVGWELLADLRANPSIAEEVNTLVKNSLTMVVPDPASIYSDVNLAWEAFNDIFRAITPLLTYLPVFEDYFYQGLTELRDDNILYIELRTTLPTLYDLDGNTYGPLDVAKLYKRTTDRFVSDYPDFIGAKLIYAPLRLVTTATMDEYLIIAEALKTELSEFVAGFDLVGQEEKGEPLSVFADQLRAVAGDIRFFFHAGETDWNGLSTDENLIDAVLLNTTRIGHGYAIVKHPVVMELARQRDIAVEVNPISNQVLKLVGDLRNHPASYLFAQDFPVVVSSDDPGLWGAKGLSYDFYEAFVGMMSRSADIRALKQLAINSIRYSAMSDDEKYRAYEIWTNQWSTFISDLVGDFNVV